MTTWTEFEQHAPHIAEIFRRRHSATGHLCFLATLRADGYPRICPLEPQLIGGQLALVGMPGTRKFDDLHRDPRFSLHTATVDTQVGEGDAKLWGRVREVDTDAGELLDGLIEIYRSVGHDRSEQNTFPMFVADVVGASSLELVGNRLRVTIWKTGGSEQQLDKE